jgi:two-component system OmpR family sensor kinase
MTLRSRFLLSSLIVGGGTLALVGGVIDLEVRKQLRSQFDDHLVDRLRRASPVGARAGSLPVGLCSAARQVMLIDEQGAMISSCAGPQLPKPSLSAIRDALVQGYSLYRATVGEAPVRMVLMRLTPGSGEPEEHPLLLQAAESLRLFDETRSDMRRNLVLIFAAGLAFITLASWIAIRRSLVQVGRIADTARSILRGDRAGVIEDVSEGDEVGALVDAVNELFERLQRVAAAQRRFVADAARELGQPLHRLRGELDRLCKGERPAAEYRGTVEKLSEEMRRLGHLVDALVLAARIDAGIERVPPDARTDLAEAARTALEELHGRFAEKGVEVALELASGVRARGTPALLLVVPQALLDNAARRVGPRGRVRIIARVDAETAHLVVEDDGAPLPREVRDRVFERFARVAEGDYGVGLSLARDVARLHGGDVKVDDSPLGGVRFEARLRRAED